MEWIKENAYFRWLNEGCLDGHHLRHWCQAELEYNNRKIAMSRGIVNSADTGKLIYILPRIRLSGTVYRQDSFTVSKATLLPDDSKSWDEVVQLPRPSWLDIYRQFPYLHSNEPPDPARGTLVVSEDEEWLKKHISRVIAVVYALGLEESRWQVPADAFQYSSFKAFRQPHELVTLYTKRGGKTEDLNSLKLLPSLEIRGVPSSFRANLQDEKSVELIRRFDSNPYDRLVVACYHLFRSQFDNPVIAPIEQDFSAYCACLEAALDVTGPDYSKELSGKIASIYGKYPAMERWIKGLYSERSVFNHGVSTELSIDNPDDRVRALVEFRQLSLNWDVLRKLCLDVIKEQLAESNDTTNREIARMFSPVRAMLRKLFFSEKIWAEIAKVFTQSKSVSKIRALNGDDLDDLIELCCSYLNGHSWQAMKGKAESKKVLATLKSMAGVFGECAKDKNDTAGQASANQLFQAASNGDTFAIDHWARIHAHWKKQYSASDLEEAAKAIAVHTAEFFDI